MPRYGAVFRLSSQAGFAPSCFIQSITLIIAFCGGAISETENLGALPSSGVGRFDPVRAQLVACRLSGSNFQMFC